MNKLIDRIKSFRGEVSFRTLKEFIEQLDIELIHYDEFVNAPLSEGDYGRNILTLNPFECVLINWPPGVESAVHHHEGLFGYVWVLEGELDNHFYRKSNCNVTFGFSILVSMLKSHTSPCSNAGLTSVVYRPAHVSQSSCAR